MIKLHKVLFSHWTNNELHALCAALETAQRIWKSQATRRGALSAQLQRLYAWYATILKRLSRAANVELKKRWEEQRTNPNAKLKNYDRP